MRRRFLVAPAVLFVSLSALAATQGGPIPVPLPLFPPNNWWNTDISNAPADPNSSNFTSFIGTGTPLHPDWGGDVGNGTLYGFPYIIVEGSQAKLAVNFFYSDQSDGVDHNTDTSFPFYPIPSEAITNYGWIEGGPPGNVDVPGDRHILIVDRTNNTLYELYNVYYNGTNWEAGSGAFFDMNTNNRRPDTWTSADAAGLAILPGLVRYDEVYGPNEITHAFRVTVSSTNGYVFPASHEAGTTAGALPMGARLRLKASTDISGFSADVQKIYRAFKKYGLIVADNGSNMYISGAYDNRWDMEVMNNAFGQLQASDFEVVQLGWKPSISLVISIPTTVGSGDAATATVTAYESNDGLATGYRGTVRFASTDGSATLPADYAFTATDNGTHTFPSGFVLPTPGGQTISATDIADATITGSRIVIVGPPTPAGLLATAASATSVNLSWNVSAGAAQYEVFRGNSPLATTMSTSYTDSPVTPGTTYVYRVRAIDSSSRPSPLSAPDAATTILFTEDPVVAATTLIKAAHIDQLRTAVNAMRNEAGIGPFSFTDSTLSGVAIRVIHIQELRAALDPARAALGLPPIVYTDASLAAGMTVKAAHVQELRSGVK